MTPIVARLRVVRYTMGEGVLGVGHWHEVRQDPFTQELFVPGEKQTRFYYTVALYRIDLGKNTITFQQNHGRGQYSSAGTFACDYEFEWLILNNDEIDFVIKYEAQCERTTEVAKFLACGKDSGFIKTTPPIWLRQARGAQITAIELPAELQRLVFNFLWQPVAAGVYGGVFLISVKRNDQLRARRSNKARYE